MAYGGSETTKRDSGIARFFALLFESIGVLNKGSADTPAAPEPGGTDQVQPVSTNTLNVTRVGGLTTVVGGVAAATLEVLQVDKGKDATAIVVAGYAAVAVIVAAALITVAIIIAADIRARQAIAIATSKPQPPGSAASPPQSEHAEHVDVDVSTSDGARHTEVTIDR